MAGGELTPAGLDVQPMSVQQVRTGNDSLHVSPKFIDSGVSLHEI